MNYKKFLQRFLEINDIDYGFCISNTHKKELQKYNINDTFSYLAFAPIKYEEKRRIFAMILNKEIKDTIQLNGNIENIYSKFNSMYPTPKSAIENYIIYFYDWISIVNNDEVNKKTIKFLKKNIDTKNSLFWFNLTKVFYNKSKFIECLDLIKFIKKEIIPKEDYLNKRLSFYELVSLKKAFNYLQDETIFRKICKVAKKVLFEDYEKIITFFECALVSNNDKDFNKFLAKYYDIIFNWSILDILNLFELAIYTKNNELIDKVETILLYKDIMAYTGEREEDTYMFLKAVLNDDMEDIGFYKKNLEQDTRFDFSHYEWYLLERGL